MKNLLDLPPELLANIFNTLVSYCGLEAAVKARSVCHFFDEQIEQAIWATKVLEERHGKLDDLGGRPLGDYIFRCILADDMRCQHLKSLIFGALEYLNDARLCDISVNAEFVRAACRACARGSHGYTFSSWVQPAWEYCCKPAESALAIAASAGWVAVVRQLIEKGVPDARTLFGSPLSQIAQYGTPALASEYLTSRLKVPQTSCQHASPCECLNSLTDSGISSRNISLGTYESAVRDAIRGNNAETMKLIFDAAGEDGLLDRIPDGASHKAPTVRTNILHEMMCEAMRWQRFDIVKFVLDNGVSPDDGLNSIPSLNRLPKPWNPLMTSFLLGHGGNPARCPHGSLLTHAVCKRNETCVKKWLRAGMTNYSKTTFGEHRGGLLGPHICHPLYWATSFHRGDANILRLLLENGVTFEVGSELDYGLPPYVAHPYNGEWDVEILQVLSSYRNAQSSTQDQQQGANT